MDPIFNYEVNRHNAPKPHQYACEMNNYYATGFIYSIYKIGARKWGHTSGFERSWGSGGFGVGLRVWIWGSVSAGAFSDNGVDLGVPGSRTWFGVGGASVSPWSVSILSMMADWSGSGTGVFGSVK